MEGVRIRPVAARLALLLAVLLGACEQRDPLIAGRASPTPSALPSPPPGEPRVLEPGGPTGGALEPGVYVTGRFQPRLTFRVDESPRSGWSLDLDVPDLLALAKEEFAFLSFLNPIRVINARTGKPARRPADFVAWIENHPYLDVGDPSPTSIGGLRGTQFDVGRVVPAETHPCPSLGGGPSRLRCVAIAPISNGAPFILAVDAVARITVLEVEGRAILVIAEDDAGSYEEFLPEAERLLETVEFRP